MRESSARPLQCNKIDRVQMVSSLPPVPIPCTHRSVDRTHIICREREMSAYEFTVIGADGASVDLQRFKGNVTLIVNTSSYDQKAKQSYELLASVYQKYKDEDLSILLFPCSQFGSPETNACVESEFLSKHGLTNAGLMMKEVDVNGPNTTDLYKFLKKEKPGAAGGFIRYNFTIFIVDRQGQVQERITSNMSQYAMDEILVKYFS